MKNKKFLFLLVGVLIVILILLFFIIKNFKIEDKNKISEYTPAEEISSSQLRETTINLYFVDSSTGELKSEGKLIDSAILLENPYQELTNLLLAGPETQNLVKVFPENTQILDATLEKNCAVLNFSTELLNFSDETQKYNIINSILNTLSTLNEVSSIKILVDNTLPDGFELEYTVNTI